MGAETGAGKRRVKRVWLVVTALICNFLVPILSVATAYRKAGQAARN